MVYRFFNSKTESVIRLNEQLLEEKFKRKKVFARFKDSIWAADLAELESVSPKK